MTHWSQPLILTSWDILVVATGYSANNTPMVTGVDAISSKAWRVKKSESDGSEIRQENNPGMYKTLVKWDKLPGWWFQPTWKY